ncbi:MAG: flagellar motor switch protein FliM [Planctomycetes bacterium]|nr:flagellar motor switch protein FliM [Planctomycetota bacterium]
MAEPDKILSQHEVDALLSAIDSGEIEVGIEEQPGRQVMPYDFKRPERVARDQLRAIETLHDVFARDFQSALSGQLRSVVDVKVASVDQLTFSEFINSLPNPTVFTVLSCEPLEGSFIFELNPIIAFPIYERLLGAGRASSVQPERPLSELEWNVLGTVIDTALERMKKVWADVVDVNFQIRTRESNPQIMQIFSANEPVISVVLELAMGEHKGYVNICIPVMSIEGLMEKITAHTWFASRKREESPGQETAISRQLAPAELTVSAHLAIESIPMEELKNLRSGDLLATNHHQAAPLIVSIEGRPKFTARIGALRDRRAVKISGGIDPSREPVVLLPHAELRLQKGEAGAFAETPPARVDHILSLPVSATVVLAEKPVPLRFVLGLRPGDIIEFDKGVETPLDFEVTGRKIARGTAVKMGERFGIQIGHVKDARETVRSLGT